MTVLKLLKFTRVPYCRSVDVHFIAPAYRNMVWWWLPRTMCRHAHSCVHMQKPTCVHVHTRERLPRCRHQAGLVGIML